MAISAPPQRTVAITIDDLPYATAGDRAPTQADRPHADSINRAIITALGRRHVPTTGFVIQTRVEQLGGERILEKWTDAHLELGNHSYSHPDFNKLSVDEIENEIVRGEASLRSPRYFRFPFNHDGDTREKHDSVAAFLTGRGYHVATCTMQNDDWLFNRRYIRALADGDTATAARVRRAYLEYTNTEITYYASLSRQVLGYEPPQVMLLHDNQLNADVMDSVLSLFEHNHYRFVTLATAQNDPAYQIPDTVVTPDGPMWAYRWARARHVTVNGSLEQEPPAWITE
jgi:peptidoglycan/xylan/chitin deacetylase (PgdA/CDA1 family)